MFPLESFQKIIWQHYATHRRPFPWRDIINPYHVTVSEIMLQQTQTDRVLYKFEQFICEFPDFQTLATAPFDAVLRAWKGLGYNRRAMALQKIAQIVVNNHNGQLPDQPEILETFPGIGKATACSITTFAFNKPTMFIETNVRTVFIHFFFKEQESVHDKEIEPLVIQTVDQLQPREWYYALMDYGVMLKKTVGNSAQKSKHYHKQSRFVGSDRQIRGMILQALLDHTILHENDFAPLLNKEPKRVAMILDGLVDERFIEKADGLTRLCKQL